MEFDEYEYLEKSVDELEAARSKKKHQLSDEKRERGRKTRDEDDDGEMKRKKSRSGDDENRRERKRDERDRGRNVDRDRDRERRDREKERERRGDGEREKERSRYREREKDRLRRSTSRSRRHGSWEPKKDSESDKDKEREWPRWSRSRSRRDGSREPEKDSESDKDKEREWPGWSRNRSRRDGSREPEKDKESELKDMGMRDSRRFKVKKETEPEADPERDQRTVFAYQMPLKAAERDVYEFFSKAGKVRDARVIMDRSARRSKGVAYIEFYDAMSVPMAIALSGQLLLGQPVMVKPSEAEKNLVQSTAATGSSVSGPYGQTDRKLYVGNLNIHMTEQQLREIFEPFGPVELVQLPLDLETGQCKGFGFVQFAEVGHAKAALILNGTLEIAGRYIKVSSVSEHVSGQDAGTNAADFDDDYGGGLSLNAQSRALLMQKLDRTGTASSIAGSLGLNGLNGSAPTQHPFPLPFNGKAAIPALPSQVLPVPVSEPVGNPSECLLLKNLFDPATETDPEFDLDIKDDVGEECSKFGRVRHIRVDRHSDGHVYLRFDNKEDAMSAQRGMHVRWFARRLISAIFVPPQDYERKFPDVVW